MLDYAVMGVIVIFLFFMLAFRAEYQPHGNDAFFDQRSTQAMRGFWSLVVILVHIPHAYQNAIQDLVGSFAYIGVTFFFMASAYGLSASLHRKPDSIRTFWRTRLPRLIIPNWTANILFSLLFLFAFGEALHLSGLVHINRWVLWLLGCYAAFWAIHRFGCQKCDRSLLVCLLVTGISIVFYLLGKTGLVQGVTWCTEVFGFVWGMLLYAHQDRIKGFFLRNWLVKSIGFCLLSLLLGVLYLRVKPLVFWGDYLLKSLLGLSILSFILSLNSRISIGNWVSAFLGDISFEVYLIHATVFKLIATVFPGIGSGSFILAAICMTVFFAAVIHRLCTQLFRGLYPRKPR